MMRVRIRQTSAFLMGLCFVAVLIIGCSEDPIDGTAGGAASFNASRAFQDLADQVALGPRPMGSEASARTRDLIQTRLRQAGWPVRELPFEAVGPSGEPVAGVNLIATLEGGGNDTRRIWLGAHYDTKNLDLDTFVGANDAASGVALLLELARVLAAQRREPTYELVFFDGEESIGPNISGSDGLYGSRALARSMAQQQGFGDIEAFILVDMVADRDLNLTPDLGSASWLQQALVKATASSDPGLIDDGASLRLVDDHIPFKQAGLSDVLAVIDFQFGARVTPGPTWHTPADDLASVSAESLNRVGRAVVQLLNEVERSLIAGGT